MEGAARERIRSIRESEGLRMDIAKRICRKAKDYDHLMQLCSHVDCTAVRKKGGIELFFSDKSSILALKVYILKQYTLYVNLHDGNHDRIKVIPVERIGIFDRLCNFLMS